jgi:hypothetical protein
LEAEEDSCLLDSNYAVVVIEAGLTDEHVHLDIGASNATKGVPTDEAYFDACIKDDSVSVESSRLKEYHAYILSMEILRR